MALGLSSPEKPGMPVGAGKGARAVFERELVLSPVYITWALSTPDYAPVICRLASCFLTWLTLLIQALFSELPRALSQTVSQSVCGSHSTPVHAFENKALGLGWLGGVRKSPLQLLRDLEQGPRSALAEVHRQRRDLLRRTCSRHTRRQRLLRPEDLRHVLVDDAHGLLYCYVPKVACTNWKRVLLALGGRARGDPLAIPAHEAHAPGLLPSLADFGPAEINRRLRDYLAFLFVREPFERLASAYRNKLARPYSAAFQRRYGTRIVRRLRPRAHPDALARGHDVRFAEFLSYLLDPRTRRLEPFNEHWERAHALCHPCRLRYDVVGKFETLAEDAAFVLGLVGAPGLRFPAPPPKPRAVPAREQARRLFQDISPFYQRRLFDLYKMDFLLFNYSAPSYLRLH